MNFEKSDLVFEYEWKKYNDWSPKVSGEFGRTPFERNQGNQVLYFINEFMRANQLERMDQAKKIERMLNELAAKGTQLQFAGWVAEFWLVVGNGIKF